MNILNIAYSRSETDKAAWSGTAYQTFKALKVTGHNVSFLAISPYDIPRYFKVVWYLYRLFEYLHLTRKTYLFQFSRFHRDAIYHKLKKYDYTAYDCIFVTSGADIVSAVADILQERAEPDRIVLLSDAPFCGIENYYPTSSNLYAWHAKEANAISKEAFMRSNKVIVSSDWAKKQAEDCYGIKSEKMITIEFGANIESDVLGKRILSYSSEQTLNVFFSGVEWVRKGGDVAVECCRELINMGIKVVLHIVGVTVPPKYAVLPFIRSYGYLDKNIPEENTKYLQVLEAADIMLFPSRAECAGIVLCEAAGYGLPVFCYDTGGVGNYVINDVNGMRLPMVSTGGDFAVCIKNCLDNGSMNRYSIGASRVYQEKLNWKIWAQRVQNEVLEEK